MQRAVPTVQVVIDVSKHGIRAVHLPPRICAVDVVMFICDKRQMVASHSFCSEKLCAPGGVGKVGPSPIVGPEGLRGFLVEALFGLPGSR